MPRIKKYNDDNTFEEVVTDPVVLPMSDKSSELKSPKEWAIETGNAPKKTRNEWRVNGALNGLQSPRGSIAHEVATVLHGWNQHEYNTGSPLLMTKEDYLKALSNAMCETGNPEAHAPVLSPHKEGVLVTFK